MIEQWIIDGYNLLRGQGRLNTKARGPSQVFFARVADFAATQSCRAIVVLDGIGNNAEFESFRTAAFSVCYSQEVSADTYIERYLALHIHLVRPIVVTDDRAIVLMARGMGARAMPTEEFMKTMEDAAKIVKDTIFKQRVREHSFNRPFDRLLKKKGS